MSLHKRSIIGCTATISASGNPTLVGIVGVITDESKNMITLRTQKGDMKIIKNTVTLEIEGTRIEGSELIGTAEERIKKKVKK